MLRKVATTVADEERVWHIAWSPNGTHIAACGTDRMVKIYALSCVKSSTADTAYKLECVATLEDAQSRTVRSAEWSPSGHHIAAVSFDKTCALWEKQAAHDSWSPTWELVASLEGHDNEVKSVSWNHDGHLLATCGRDRTVWIWETSVENEYECLTVLNKHTQDVKFVLFHPSEQLLCSCSYDDTIRVWGEYDDDWYEADVLTGHASTVWGVTFLNADTLLSCSDDQSVLAWTRVQDQGKSSWLRAGGITGQHGGTIYSIHAHDARYVATGCADNGVRVFSKSSSGVSESDVSFELEVASLDAHSADVNCVRWRPARSDDANALATDVTLLASAGDDGRICIWQFDPA